MAAETQQGEQIDVVQRPRFRSRRALLYMAAVVFGVWALSMANIRSC